MTVSMNRTPTCVLLSIFADTTEVTLEELKASRGKAPASLSTSAADAFMLFQVTDLNFAL